MELTVRKCEFGDLPALILLYNQLHPSEELLYEDAEWAYHTLTANDACSLYLVLADGAIAATFTLYILPNLTHGGRPAAVIENIVVDQTLRNKGIGKYLIQYAKQIAIDNNCYKLSLTSNVKRKDAHEFYKRIGMVQHACGFRFEL